MDELALIHIPPLNILFLEGSLEILYVTRVNLSQGKQPSNFSMRRHLSLFWQAGYFAFRCRLGGLGQVEGGGSQEVAFTTPANPKEKRAHSQSPTRKAKKNKGPSFPPDLILGFSEALVVEAGAEDGAPLVMVGATPIGMGKAMEREEGPMTLMVARVEASEA